MSEAVAKLILTAPVVSLLTSTSTPSFVVTVTTTDYAGLGNAARGMSRVAACLVRDLIAERIATEPAPTPEVVRYFDRIHSAAVDSCEG